MRFAFILLATILFSCKLEIQGPITDDKSILTTRTVDLPIVTDGILVFEDSLHFETYYHYLYLLSKSGGNPDSTLSIEESRLSGFVSLRSDTYLDSIPDHLFETTINSDFVVDIVYKSILNQNYEFAIDNIVYVYTGLNRFYKIVGWDYNAINKFRLADKGTLNTHINCYTSNVSYANYNLEYKASSTTYPSTPIEPRSVTVRINRSVVPLTICENLCIKLEAVLESYTGSEWVPFAGDADWAFNFGDGQGWSALNTNTFSIDHCYWFTGAGSYNGWIQVTYVDPEFGPKTMKQNITFVVFDRECRRNELNVVEHVESGNIRMVAHSWFKESLGQRQGAETESWYKNSHGNWNKKKAQLNVWCGAMWYDGYVGKDCAFVDFTQDSDSGNSRQELVHMRLHNPDVYATYKDEFQVERSRSTHRLEASGVVLVANLELKYCY